MKAKLTLIQRAALLVLLSTLNSQLSTFAQTTAFTYQGRLTENGAAANSTNDFNFTLYDAGSGGGMLAFNLVNDLAISNGLFTVTLDFGASLFDGSARWLQIAVRPGTSAGTYTNLDPRQRITAAPYAMRALNAGTAGSATTATSVGAGGVNNLALAAGAVDGAKILDGSITSADLNPSLLNTTFWKLGGNEVAPGQFLGSTNNQPLEFKMNNQRALRLEPTANLDTVNVIGGSARNVVGAGIVGATIGGGGSGDYHGALYTNRVEGDFGTVSGGGQNTIQFIANYATIGGGSYNTIQTNAALATIGGGSGNTIKPNARFATIGGGRDNTIQSNSENAFLGGGYLNTIDPNAFYSTIGGGSQNTIQTNAESASIVGGFLNTIQYSAFSATIGGGVQNTILPGAHYATIPGGRDNTAAFYAFAAGRRAKANYTGAFVWADSQDADFASTADNQFLIRAAGNVGINKTTPATALDVNGIVTATSFSGNGAGLTNVNGGNVTGTLADARLSTNVALRSGGNIFSGNQIFNSGNIGIGTASPAAKLDVAGNLGYSGQLTKLDVAEQSAAYVRSYDLWFGHSSRHGSPGRALVDLGSSLAVNYDRDWPGLHLFGQVVLDPSGQNTNGTLSGGLLFGGSGSGEGIISNRGAGGNPYGLDFYTFFQPRLSIANNGNVGIGTNNPQSALHVAGTVRWAASSLLSPDQGGSIELGNSLGIGTPFIDFHYGLGSSQDYNVRLINNADGQLTVEGGVRATGTVTAPSFNGTAGTTLMLGTTDNQPLELKVNNQRGLRLELGGSNSVNVIGGWMGNGVAPGVAGATVAGGGAGDYLGGSYTNRVEADFSTVSGGAQNTIQTSATFSTIGGGYGNTIQTLANYATIGGGSFNTSSGFQATVGGGGGNTSGGERATVGGGSLNTSSGSHATVGGGGGNTSSGFQATVGGGLNNNSSGEKATVGGGEDNTSSGTAATVPGGRDNVAGGIFSFAAGFRAKANHDGAFLWGDTQFADFSSTANNQFLIRAAGGVGINTNNPAGAALAVNGVVTATSSLTEAFEARGTVAGYSLHDRVTGAAGRWVMYAQNSSLAFYGFGANRMTLSSTELRVNSALVLTSDRNVKSGFERIEAKAILEKVAALPITRWHYTNDTATTHLGPMAQDFHAAFAVGHDNKGIATVDADGVALAAIQGLNQKVDSETATLRAENAELKQRLEKLEQLMNRQDGGTR